MVLMCCIYLSIRFIWLVLNCNAPVHMLINITNRYISRIVHHSKVRYFLFFFCWTFHSIFFSLNKFATKFSEYYSKYLLSTFVVVSLHERDRWRLSSSGFRLYLWCHIDCGTRVILEWSAALKCSFFLNNLVDTYQGSFLFQLIISKLLISLMHTKFTILFFIQN